MNLLHKLAATAILAGLTVGLVRAEPDKTETKGAPVKAQAGNGSRLTHDKLKAMLDLLGYTYQERKSTVGDPMYFVEMTRDGWDFKFYVSLSSDGTQVWLTSALAELPDSRDIPVERLEKLLAASNDAGPCHFCLKGRWIYCCRAMENQGVTPGQLRTTIDEFNDRIKTNHKVWDVSSWSKGDLPQDPRGISK